MSSTTKKRKADTNVHATSGNKKHPTESNADDPKTARATFHAEVKYKQLSLQDIHDRIQALCRRVPEIPESNFALSNHKKNGFTEKSGDAAESTVPLPKNPCPYDKEEIRKWAASLQIVIEEFNLLVSCVSPATYIWGTDRSGAAEQNLSLLSGELIRSQEQIMARVTPRLNDVLAPVVTLVTDKTVTKKLPDGTEIKQNYFATTLEDPEYVDMCFTILARNAPLLRQVLLANYDKLLQSIEDYLAAQHKDSQHDARGFVY
ncbi:hypothetical protein FisN_4Lh209 [Fistulifera solaris]|uniref:Uncharacterized protein n=1 Tax=Fistulifera solaris TaxID=1519565 RepID=A0A1Z5JZC3_FISSO|nr:hypothetical protein FisN_4Lh209 [Fistulifera solaris]|eukprot:GAX19206.1 hypothetical protein FisN_4Lh209 [Fistulifera solaris]